MKITSALTRSIQAAAIAAMLSACGHGIKKADIPGNAVPSDEISRLEADISKAYDSQYDILANKEFAKARSWLDEAKSDLKKNQKQSEILDDVAYGRAWLEKTESKAKGGETKIAGILDARKAALAAGARNFPQHNAALGDIDDDARSVATGKLSTEKFNRLQSRYFDLELAAITSSQLDKAQASISAAKKNRADSYAPKYLKIAEIAYTDAKNKIAVSRHNADGFRDAVTKANEASLFLVETTSLTRGKGEPTEDVAAEMVKQKLQISSLKGKLGQAANEQAQMSETMNEQGKQLSEAAAAISLDKALADAQKEFNKKEAEVYRQGDKLLIRLKDIKFETGKSALPAAALPLLAKVRTITQDLNPSAVVVEGHTDSTGNKAVNLQLSQDRAQAVATYFEKNGIEADKITAVGQGYKVPIANNKSKEGRAKNRRVDIIVTPSAAK